VRGSNATSLGMTLEEFLIRDAREDDAPAIAAIYAHHVLHGTASYDTDPPSVEVTVAKIRRIEAAGWPFLVAEEGGQTVGYCYATQFRDRAAYAFTCENSIYVHREQRGQGIGKALLQELLTRSEQTGFRQMVAVIGGAEEASVRLHSACGFREVGRLEAVGWKFGRWLDNVYMQKALGPGASEPAQET
jgi:L-amino acid N-acyltransferase YncA